MEKGRIVESGTVGELLATPGSELAAALFPVGGDASGADRTVVDVTFHGEAATQPVISQLSRTYNIDISILGAAMDTVGGQQIGRMRIELPGRYEDNVVPIGFLREQGLQVEVVDGGPAERQRRPARCVQGGAEVTWSEMQPLLSQAFATPSTWCCWSTLITVVGGLPLGILLVLTDKGGLLQNVVVNKVIGAIVNIGRSLPFIILLVALIPFTRWVTGTTIGPTAADRAARHRRHPVLRAARRDGGPRGRRRARRGRPVHGRQHLDHRPQGPAARGAALAGLRRHHHVIALIGYSAMAGAVGGGGLGDLAVRYGYQRFETELMWITVRSSPSSSPLIQFAGDFAARSLHGRGGRPAPAP